jgi:hypothetical protein
MRLSKSRAIKFFEFTFYGCYQRSNGDQTSEGPCRISAVNSVLIFTLSASNKSHHPLGQV